MSPAEKTLGFDIKESSGGNVLLLGDDVIIAIKYVAALIW